MIVANFDGRIETLRWLLECDPVAALHPELIAIKLRLVTDDHAIRVSIEIDHISRPQGPAGKPFALADRKKLNPVVLGNKIPIHVVNFASMKFPSSAI